jgi:hypothetical protein
MKNTSKKLIENNIGEQVKVIFESDIPKLLKTLSKETWLTHFPQLFIDLLNTSKNQSIKAIRYAPNIYFSLNTDLQKDKQIIKATINSYSYHKRLKEIDTKVIPLIKRG